MKVLNPIMMSGKKVLPLVEGGKGINGSDGKSAGAWAREGGIGTFSGISPDFYDENGNVVKETYEGKSRLEKHKEMIAQAIRGGIAQAKIAHQESQGNGRIHINMLWESGGAEEILHGVLDGAKKLVHGVTCGAGLPYKLGEIASKYEVYYYPIVSSARAFQILWKRAYSNFVDFFGGIVYEDPWLAGGHNGLTNAEDPKRPEDPYERILKVRKAMEKAGLSKDVPIIIAGGVWALKDWQDYIDNEELGNVAFQFGTRPMVTKESPVSEAFKKLLLTLKKGDVILQKFSPTGFFSSAIKNSFLEKLIRRTEEQVPFAKEKSDELDYEFKDGSKSYFIKSSDYQKAESQIRNGYNIIQTTPDNTLVFLNQQEADGIKEDRKNCVGCISACSFSSWTQYEGLTMKSPDPRSFCIHKTLYDLGHGGRLEDNLLFAGHQVYNFADDPLYKNGHIPTVKELVAKIKLGL